MYIIFCWQDNKILYVSPVRLRSENRQISLSIETINHIQVEVSILLPAEERPLTVKRDCDSFVAKGGKAVSWLEQLLLLLRTYAASLLVITLRLYGLCRFLFLIASASRSAVLRMDFAQPDFAFRTCTRAELTHSPLHGGSVNDFTQLDEQDYSLWMNRKIGLAAKCTTTQ